MSGEGRFYMAAVGHDNEAELQRLRPQPRNAKDIQYPAQTFGGDSSVDKVGEAFVELTFTVTEYLEHLAVLDAFGLAVEDSAEGTYRLRDDFGFFRNYNGTASKTTGKERGYGTWRNTVIVITGLERV